MWDKGGSTCLQNGDCCVEPDAKIVKASFPSFGSIFDQSTLLKTSQTNRKCAQESSSGKRWVLKSKSYDVSKIHLDDEE